MSLASCYAVVINKQYNVTMEKCKNVMYVESNNFIWIQEFSFKPCQGMSSLSAFWLQPVLHLLKFSNNVSRQLTHAVKLQLEMQNLAAWIQTLTSPELDQSSLRVSSRQKSVSMSLSWTYTHHHRHYQNHHIVTVDRWTYHKIFYLTKWTLCV